MKKAKGIKGITRLLATADIPGNWHVFYDHGDLAGYQCIDFHKGKSLNEIAEMYPERYFTGAMGNELYFSIRPIAI